MAGANIRTCRDVRGGRRIACNDGPDRRDEAHHPRGANHRDDLAGRGQDVVGDLFQELLLIEYEIVYENYCPGSAGRQPLFRKDFRALVTHVISGVQFWIIDDVSIMELAVLISNAGMAIVSHTTK